MKKSVKSLPHALKCKPNGSSLMFIIKYFFLFYHAENEHKNDEIM